MDRSPVRTTRSSGSVTDIRFRLRGTRSVGHVIPLEIRTPCVHRGNEELFSLSRVIPAVNQVEFIPFCFQKELLDFCRKHHIQLQAYSPLTRGRRLDDPPLVKLTAQYHCSVPQLLIRWAIQHDVVAIPKASNLKHIRENAQVFDFSITDEDMVTLNRLNENLHLCWDPTNVL